MHNSSGLLGTGYISIRQRVLRLLLTAPMMLPALAPSGVSHGRGRCGRPDVLVLTRRYDVAGDPRQETLTELHDRAAGQRTTTRRDFLRYSGMGAAMLGGAAALAACSSSSTPSASTSPTAAGKPKMGGALHAGLTGGTGSDTVDAHSGVNNVDFARIIACTTPLIGFDLNAQNQLRLAESITPNKDATVWTMRLRPGVTFHNGKPLTADDVIYTLNADRQQQLGAASSLAPCRCEEHEEARQAHGPDAVSHAVCDPARRA